MPSVKRLFRAAPIPGAIALVIVGSNASAQPGGSCADGGCQRRSPVRALK